MGDTLDRVPGHLRRFVVQQDYEAYTAVDHAVWRFVLRQMFDRLRHSAHPAYSNGLTRTGMSLERIPRIAEMDACLADFGWGAVCVDGFIPPRAFQEFQALGILPIAADMRRLENLAYTPAPDIIHEAAGHAPILPDPEYAGFLRRISECGMRAFASRRDHELFDAVRQLSIVKELRDADPGSVETAERGLATLMAQSEPPSEATRLARLYWWTVEYGLVGRPDDYKLYGAGLLSSLAESHFCHDARVDKRPLTPDAVYSDYDITQAQPQLFVARDFAHLSEVLEQACAQCAFRVGGLGALETARASAELATVELDAGLELIGSVAHAVPGDAAEPVLLRLQGRCAIAEAGAICRELDEVGPAIYAQGLAIGFLPPVEGDAQAGLRLQRWAASRGTPLEIDLGRGLVVEGRVRASIAKGDGRELRAVVLEHAQARQQDGPPMPLSDTLALVARSGVRGVRAGVSAASYWPPQRYPDAKVPRVEHESESQRALRVLYEQEASPRQRGGAPPLIELHERLAAHPDDWLLRWNLLARLSQLGVEPGRRARLVDELRRLELRFERKYPIAMGLGYLGYPEGHD